ncbi:hypothetical protein PILCRDRAFT_363465 [Piloderma croceum F 1598]|uniref:Uncharacterized protein n=1 Tax=Piloderma croceum (strain F 1598) TaxID=765440 RepID=A0A0C3G048_PILCF|nr:hypothetical protein PILCRDRAFT_363465 [Piloderma croceum F 1598]
MSSSRTIAEGGKRLPRAMAERLVELAPSWRRGSPTLGPHMYEGCIHRAVTILMMLVIATKGHVVPEITKTTLVRWLDTWTAYKIWSPASMVPDNDLSMACRTLSMLLKGEVASKLIKQLRRGLKCIEVCALPTCTIETNLKTCANRTVAYVSIVTLTFDQTFARKSGKVL